MSPFPISKTKILVPKRRAEIVTRPRLIEALYDLLDKKLMLISAPAGFGKSSLLIDFVDQSEIPICWLSLDELDQESQRFLSYFAACINERFPAFGKESFAAIKNISSVDKDIEKLVIAFTNEIHQNIPEHFAIVLDDYHFIDSIPEVRIFINRFVQLAGENCHLILASRTLPALPDLHLLAARDQVGGISFEDLAFLPEEIQVFFKQNSGEKLSLDDANQLADKTEGWVTSLTLSNLSHIGMKASKGASGAQARTEVFDYFAREILGKQSADIREFLLLTSFFDEVMMDLCNKVLTPLVKEHALDWKSLFEIVQKSSLFVVPLGTDGKSFRYHHLFQDFLRAELQARDPRLVHEMMLRLAKVYEEEHEWEKAHFIYATIGDQDALVDLIEQAGAYFIRNSRIATLGNWLEQLPVLVLEQSPTLLSLQGVITHIQGETQLGISLLGQAEATFRANQEVEDLAQTLVRRAAAYRDVGEYNLCLTDAEEVIELTGQSSDDGLKEIFAMAQRIKGLALYRLGKTREAVSWFENALHLLSSLKDRSLIPVLEMELGLAHLALGNNDLAIKFYDRALRAWESTGNLGWQATLLNNLGVLYHSKGNYEQAFTMFEKALDCARGSGYVRAQSLALCSLGDLLADLRDLDRSDECYDQALIIASQLADGYLIFYSSIAKARLARLRANFSLAERLLLNLSSHIENRGSADEEALFRLEYGCMLLFSNRPHESVDEFSRGVNLYEESGRVLDLCISRLWLVSALTADGQKDGAISQLRNLFLVSRNLKEPGALYVNAEQVRPWLEKLQPPDDMAVSLQQLMVKAGKFERSIPLLRRKLRQIPHTISISPPHIEIRALGPAQVFYNGNLITLSDWQRREPRDLLFFFLQSKPLTKEEIAEILWPDISPSRLKIRFRDNIYRLRRIVGVDTILFDGERYEFNQNSDYDYDVQKFDELLKQAEDTKIITEIISFLQAAINLVQGPYISDLDAKWALAERIRIETTYQSASLRLAKLYLDIKQPENTLNVCRNVVEMDPLIEDAHRLMMRAYAALGDRTAVIRQFQLCNDIFLDELGVKPSKETESLYQHLI